MKRLCFIFAFAVSLTACAQGPATQPFPPVTYTHEQRQDPPMHLHSVKVDLTDPAVHVVVSRAGDAPDREYATALLRTSQIAERDNLDIAVNGDFFMPKSALVTPFRKVPYFIGNPANVCGWAMTDGTLWSTRAAPASLLVDERGAVSIVRLGGRPPEKTRQIVSGMAMIVTDGKNTGDSTDRGPRTAAGIDKDGKKLVLLVVDGRRPEYSAGMTLSELADEMIRLGCHRAIQLDGGGSSTLVIYDPANARHDVINRPSDGHDLPLPISMERAVANVLGVRIDKKDGGAAATTRPAVK